MKDGDLNGRRAGWIFVGLAILALVLSCVIHSRHAPMWADELYTFNLIQDPSLAHLLSASGDQADGSPPLYYFFVRPWAAVFSLSEVSLRMFSCATFCVAVTLLWSTLRKAYAGWPAAISLAVVIGTSHVIRFENANIRFYGLLFALVALATRLAVAAGEREKLTRGFLAANTLCQAALVLCHPLGGAYSAALLAGGCADDWVTLRRVRWKLGLTYPVGWLALLLWARQLLHQAQINVPHSWIAVPEFRDIAGVLYGGSDLYPLLLLFVVLLAGAIFTGRRGSASAPAAAELPIREPVTRAQRRQLLLAMGLIALPLALWVFSRVFPSNPLFLARYVIGVSIGWALIVAQLCTTVGERLEMVRNRWMQACAVVVILVSFSRLVTEPGPDNRGLTGLSDRAFGHLDLPVVCPRSHDFLPREHYSPDAERYYFLLDWDAACAPNESRHGTVQFKLMDAVRRNYVASCHGHIVDGAEFLRTHPAFLVHDVPHTAWVATRLHPEEYTITPLTPSRTLDYTRDGVWPMLLVERKH